MSIEVVVARLTIILCIDNLDRSREISTYQSHHFVYNAVETTITNNGPRV